jgi:hypothetical protein
MSFEDDRYFIKEFMKSQFEKKKLKKMFSLGSSILGLGYLVVGFEIKVG